MPAPEAEFPLFEQVLADIGDNQSIQENLKHVFGPRVEYSRDGARRDAGFPGAAGRARRATDPEEGGALGVAIVEHFRAAGALTLASTHLMALKIYGASTRGVVNGSMGFDEQTFEPTYSSATGAAGQVGRAGHCRRGSAFPRTS